MKKIDLGQTITIFANIGVIVGIAMLAFEIRQNTAAVRSDVSQGLQNQITANFTMITTDPMAEIYMKGMANPSELNPIEKAKLSAFLSTVISSFENMFTLVEEGYYAEARAQGWWQVLRNLMEYPGMQRHWNERSFIYSEEFRSHVENVVMLLEPSGTTGVLDESE